MDMKFFDIWSEGYTIRGQKGPAQFITRSFGTDFRDACIYAYNLGDFEGYGHFDEKTLTLWGCHLFDNQEDARKSFG